MGETSGENLARLECGESCLRPYEAGSFGVGEAFVASLSEGCANGRDGGLTPFEAICVKSINAATAESGIDASDARTLFVLSTTKGNVEELLSDGRRVSPADAAEAIGKVVGITTEPIVVCNACISGLAAIILADRMIEAGEYDNAIVCGADMPRKFIISGFQSLKAMSASECRPFDIDRNGLNLGEAAATIILSRNPGKNSRKTDAASHDTAWRIVGGAIRNDAYHISAPHRKGEGLRLAIQAAMGNHTADDLMMINAHGTATLFNDQMESVALERAGMSDVPVNSLKGYYGHTMGAAGVVETIVTTRMAEKGIALCTRGFAEAGVSGEVRILGEAMTLDTNKRLVGKMLSGFGGCNAVAIFEREDSAAESITTQSATRTEISNRELRATHHIEVSPTGITIDGRTLKVDYGEEDILTRAYKQHIGGYPKFYKMDKLSRLGFVASELLLTAEASAGDSPTPRFTERSDRAVILFNHSSSIEIDKVYADSIRDTANYYPSPSAFVYTLPNIVTGEIAIRNLYHGETSLYILPRRDETVMQSVIRASLRDLGTRSGVCGWIDYPSDSEFAAELTTFAIDS